MSSIDLSCQLDALPVPALLVRGARVLAANRLADVLLGGGAAGEFAWLPPAAAEALDTSKRVDHVGPDGRVVQLEVAFGPAIDASGTRLAVLRDAGAEPSGLRGLERRLTFERLLTRGSATLMRSGDGELDGAIEEVLGTVGRFFGVDRAYVFLIDDPAGTQSNTHEWTADGISREASNLQDVPLDTFPWLLAQLRADRVFRYASLDALPAEAVNERMEFEREGIRSILIVPLWSGERLQGFIGFDAVRTSVDWDDGCVVGLRLLAQMLAGAIDARAVAARLRRQATHDALTGLPNRRFLRDRFATGGRRVADMFVAVVDVDDFKRVNDHHGHAGGDALLRELGRRLSAAVGAGGVVARVGGDEFVVVQPRRQETADAFAARLLGAAQAPFELPGGARTVGISAGLVDSADGAADLDAALERADAAMYRAKSAGKRRWALGAASDAPDK